MELKIEIPRDRLADLLCCAMEGGVGYWGALLEFVDPPPNADLSIPDFLDGEAAPRHISYPLCEAGGGFVLGDTEASDCYSADAAFEPVKVTYPKLLEGLAAMAKNHPRHFGNFIAGNEDAETGDVFIQCVCFGKIVFG